MKIVLDTNVIEADPGLSSQRLKLLIRHADLIGARFCMPRIVLEELPVVRKRHITDLLRKYREASKNLSKSLMNRAISEDKIDVDIAVAEFMNHVRSVLNIDNSDIVDYKDGYLAEVMDRAINRTPPCSHQGEEIRDAVLWLTVLDIAAAEPDRKVLFVSRDRAFHDGQEELRPELRNEYCNRQVEVEYYKDLGSFAEHYKLSTAALFITKDWIKSKVPIPDVLNLANESINEQLQDTINWELSFHRRGKNLSPTGYLEEVSSTVELTKFFVNELGNDEFRLEAHFEGSIEYEVEFEYVEEREWQSGRWRFDPITDDMEFVPPEPPDDPEVKSEMLYPCLSVEITVEILIKNGEVVELDVIAT